MSEEIQNFLLQMPQSLEAPYTTSSPNEAVELYSGELILRLNGREMAGDGRIFLKWLPAPRTVFEIDSLSGVIPPGDGTIFAPALNYTCPVSILSFSLAWGTGDRRVTACGGRVRDDEVPASGMVDQVIFHLPNFHHYLGESIHNADAGVWAGRLILEHDLWRIHVDAVPGADQLRT